MASRQAARVFRSATAPKNLVEVYRHKVQAGLASGRDGRAPQSLEPEIETLCKGLSRSLRDGRFRFTQYRQMLNSKGAGRAPRIISIPTARDRIVLRTLSNALVEVFPEARGVLPQVRIEAVGRALNTAKFDSFIRLDVEGFYPSVRHEDIEAALRRKIRKSEFIDVVMAAVRTPTVADGAPKRNEFEAKGVPQGLAVSNVIAEMVVAPVDDAMLSNSSCAYFRFVDDILILCDSTDADALARECANALRSLGFSVHDIGTTGKSSIGPMSEEIDYLGYVFRDGKISARSSSVWRLESSMARLFTEYKRSLRLRSSVEREHARHRFLWHINLLVTGCVYKGSACGWLHYFRQAGDLTQIKRLDVTKERLERRFRVATSMKTKSFMRAYWAIRSPSAESASYVPNYDQKTPIEMRRDLRFLGVPGVSSMNNAETRETFFRVIDKAIRDMERDVGLIS